MRMPRCPRDSSRGDELFVRYTLQSSTFIAGPFITPLKDVPGHKLSEWKRWANSCLSMLR